MLQQLLADSTHRALDTWRHLMHPQRPAAAGAAAAKADGAWAATEWSATQWSDTQSSYAMPEDSAWADTVTDLSQRA